jgi:hypothetical protein
MKLTPGTRTRLTARLQGFIFLAVLFQLYPSTLLATKVASGCFSPHCDGASFFLTKVDGLPAGQKLNMNMRHYDLSWWVYRPQEIWEDVSAERCVSVGKCEAATHARIWLDKVGPNDKRVSGKYDVEFGGEHLEGTFVLKYRKQHWICM